MEPGAAVTYDYFYLKLAHGEVGLVVDIHPFECISLAIVARLDEKDDGEATLGNDLLHDHRMLTELERLADEVRIVAARCRSDRFGRAHWSIT